VAQGNANGRISRPLVVASRWVPAGSGTPVLLYELFRHWPPESVDVFCGPGLRPRSSLSLPFRTLRLTFEPLDRGVAAIYRAAGPAAVPVVRLALARLARRLRPTVLYAHYPDGVFLTAATLVSEEHDIPLVVGFDILWEENARDALSRTFERRAAARAHRRFAITEMACEYLACKHGVPFELMPHVIVYPDSTEASPHSAVRRVVHFGGNVYAEMNLDSMVRMRRALQRLADPPPFEIFGFTRGSLLARNGLSGAGVVAGKLPRTRLLERQRTSAALFLPEAFDSPRPEMIRMNFPTKALEYALSGRPILVHAPPDSYLAVSARENGWAHVVDVADEGALADGVRRLLEDTNLSNSVVQAARRFAESRDGRKWSRVLMDALGVQG
jgi:glycosyltransferase involved in cell wall biosynthesis